MEPQRHGGPTGKLTGGAPPPAPLQGPEAFGAIPDRADVDNAAALTAWVDAGAPYDLGGRTWFVGAPMQVRRSGVTIRGPGTIANMDGAQPYTLLALGHSELDVEDIGIRDVHFWYRAPGEFRSAIRALGAGQNARGIRRLLVEDCSGHHDGAHSGAGDSWFFAGGHFGGYDHPAEDWTVRRCHVWGGWQLWSTSPHVMRRLTIEDCLIEDAQANGIFVSEPRGRGGGLLDGLTIRGNTIRCPNGGGTTLGIAVGTDGAWSQTTQKDVLDVLIEDNDVDLSGSTADFPQAIYAELFTNGSRTHSWIIQRNRAIGRQVGVRITSNGPLGPGDTVSGIVVRDMSHEAGGHILQDAGPVRYERVTWPRLQVRGGAFEVAQCSIPLIHDERALPPQTPAWSDGTLWSDGTGWTDDGQQETDMSLRGALTVDGPSKISFRVEQGTTYRLTFEPVAGTGGQLDVAQLTEQPVTPEGPANPAEAGPGEPGRPGGA